MKVADGFEVKLFASEPNIRQPLTMTFDERGRMWVIQYLQYPAPAGLKAVSVDQYLRTKYDRVPEPPPRGPKGADRITICEDTDGDGRADKFNDFVAGLNLASGLALGHGGVFVAQPPYLLFYPDRNRDDIPDGDPEVLLSGFGMEDSHAFANSLTWGPDGWLYGAHGSTVTAKIRGIEFQQGIWRYHPVTREFELFAEGGGNTWGVDFDEHGNVIAGTNFGEQIGLHQVQGGYYVKGFAKHGPLHNPYTFGYFDHIPFSGFKGGHVTCGGIIYHGGAFPAQFNGVYIAANLLANAVYWHVLERNGSSFKGRFGGELLSTDDVEFRPVDCTVGPDGSLYIADWCDKRATHVDSIDTWDRSNGRIYKIEAKGTKPAPKFDLAKQSSEALNKRLADSNDWFRREARRLLAERRDPTIAPILRANVIEAKDDRLALQSLWALYVGGGFSEDLFKELLTHRNEDIRAWTIRLLGDKGTVSSETESLFVAAARTDPSAVVRNQLACTARRLPGKEALSIIRELLQREEDAADPQIPLLIWWAIENKAGPDREAILKVFALPSLWQKPLVQQHIAERVARRYAAEGTDDGFATCARLLELAPDAAGVERVVKGMELALEGRRLEKVPVSLESWFVKAWQQSKPGLNLVRLGLRMGSAEAGESALKIVDDRSVAEPDRFALMEVLGQVGEQRSVPKLLEILEKSRSGRMQNAAVSALQRFSDAHVADGLLAVYPKLAAEPRARVRAALCSRPTWVAAFVDAVEGGRIAQSEVGFEQLRQIAGLKDAELTKRVEKRWGRVQPESAEDKRNTINQLRLVLKPSGAAGREGKGDLAVGKKLFQQSCAACHRLFGEGNEIGPDLTGADRKNTELMLLSVVDPSAYVRPEYVGFEVVTRDDQSVSGLMVESTPAAVTIVDRNNQRHTFARDGIKDIRESKLSVMPEGLLETMTPQQVMDLFSYLQSGEADKSQGVRN